MADKYIIHGATYDGDGTTSAEATADGGAGAWNDIVVGLSDTPTHGTAQDPGDTVHIKSSDASDADIDLVLSAQVLIKQGDTVNGAIRYIVDDGTVWANPGTIKIRPDVDDNCVEPISISNGYFYFDGSKRITIRGGWASEGNSRAVLALSGLSVVKNINFIFTDSTDSNSVHKRCLSSSSHRAVRFYGCTFSKYVATGNYNRYLCQMDDGYQWHFYDCVFITSPVEPTDSLFYCTGRLSYVFIIGGKWTSKHVDTKIITDNSLASTLINTVSFDTDPENVQALMANIIDAQSDELSNMLVVSTAMRNRGFGWVVSGRYGFAMYDGKGNYPYLNAVTPSGVGWAVRAMTTYASPELPFDFVKAQVYYDLAAASVAITLHIAVQDNYSVPQADKWYLKVQYTDSSDNDIIEMAKASSGVDINTDTATWSIEDGSGNPYYGARTFTKYKLSITTANQVKQNSEILLTLMVEESAPDTASFFLVDPYPEIA